MDDREMIRQIQKGKKEYLNQIAEKYYDDIYRFCCYQTGSSQDAYDLAQETFLRFIHSVGHYRYQNLKGYLLTIARNVCIDYFRDGRRRREREMGLAEVGSGEAPWGEMQGGEADVTSSQEEFLVTVAQLAEQLPQMQREAVILYYGYGFQYREIARMTETCVSTVKSRVRQGIEKLRKTVRREELLEGENLCYLSGSDRKGM